MAERYEIEHRERSRHIQIEWMADIPSLFLPQLKASVDKYLYILPFWVDKLLVMYDPNLSVSVVATFHTEKKYRWVQLQVGKGYVTGDDACRDADIRHELLHAVTQPQKDVFYQLVDALDLKETNKALYEWATDAIFRANEETTEDFNLILARFHDRPML